MLAVEIGSETIVRMLLEKGAEPGSLADDGRSPLSIAKEKGRDPIIKLLESYGAS
ncbi:hypothetical protein F4861DRAFT_501244 [Xylaria intraflava]|nr:hypothetical protein F4861DRAFT_501244 [Xylaria intraflava]